MEILIFDNQTSCFEAYFLQKKLFGVADIAIFSV